MAQLNDLLVLGNSNLLSDVNIFGALGIYGGLDISGNVSIGGTLNVDEAATFNKNVGITGNLTTNGTLNVVGTSTLTSKLTANGGIATTSITASGTVAIAQNLAVAGDTSLGGEASDKIEIIGVTTISGPVNITGNVGIIGNTSHNGIVYFANGTTYYINNAATGNLNALTLNNTTDSTATTNGALIVNGGVGIAKQLRVAGNTTLSGTLTVTGVTTLNNTADSSSISTGALIIKGGVGVTKQLRVGGNTTLTGNLTVNSGTVTIHKDTSIANDYPAKLTFSVKQTDNNITTASAYIAVYDDHDANSYGTNMVITSPSALVIGGGESASAFYSNVVKGSGSEVTYITSDGNIQFFTNCNTIGNRVGINLDTSRQFYPILNTTGSAGSLGTNNYYWANAYLGTTHFKSGHIYLEGSNASSSTGNTTQLVFGTSSTNHVVLSANDNALVINPTTSSTANQIVLYLNTQSLFPSGINATAASTFGNAISIGGALTFTGTSDGTSQIHFNRTNNPSYFTCGTGGYYCFVPNGQSIGTAASDLIIADGAVYPGTTNVTTLGKSNFKWKNVYATTFTGAMSKSLSVNGKSYNGSADVTVGTIGIAYGGTGATTASNARINLLSIGSNPITSTANDTTTNWSAYGPGATAFYSVAGYLNNQPQQYGLVMNISTGASVELHQLWASQPHGDMYHRGGNNSGWGGAWKKLVDSSNFTSVLDGTYVNISGDTMTGVLTMQGSVHEDSYTGALNMNNSDIYGLNSIYTADASESSSEGIHFYRDATHVDTLYARNGSLYFVPNRTLGHAGTSYKVIHSGGGTMTGQLLTSFKSSVAMGSYQATATTIPNLVEEVRYSSGCMGSVSIDTLYDNPTVANEDIATGWYNFIYSPHRSGGFNGAATGDNHNYGTLFLIGMTASVGCYRIRISGGSIEECRRLLSSGERLVTNSYDTADPSGTAQIGALYFKLI